MKEIALHMLDIAENSVRAGAGNIIISFYRNENKKLLILKIEDNGVGMSEDLVMKSADPFFTSRRTRDIGMGIPLFKQQAEMTGGFLEIESKKGKGTGLKAEFHYDHTDIQPLGDIAGSWVILASSHPAVEWQLNCKTSVAGFELNSNAIKKELDIKNFNDAELKTQLKRLIRNNIDEIELDWNSMVVGT